jgi:2-haloacid dehalogenase
VAPGEIMMVASHKYDLVAARAQGFRTAFIARPLEFGPGAAVDITPDPAFDCNVTNLEDLADQLGA